MNTPSQKHKPLHLVSSAATGPLSAPLSSPPIPFSPRTNVELRRDLRAQRRQSSICYISGSSESQQLRDALTSRPQALASPNPVLARTNSLDGSSRAKRRPTSLYIEPKRATMTSPQSEAPPITVADKYAPLLQFIAQKESKCMELRAELAKHEAELAALKGKWEKIVSRGNPVEAPTHPTPPVNGIDLESLKGGVGKLLKGIAAHTQPTHTQMPSLSFTSRTSSDEDSLDEQNVRTPQMSPPQVVKEVESESFILEDLGATPTLSPNPTRERSVSPSVSPLFTKRSTITLSRGVPQSSPLESACEDSDAQTPAPVPKQTTTSTFPPASSIPFQFPLDWVPDLKREVGKKIGTELSRHQKRASTIFSDVSSSLFAAIVPPSSNPSTPLRTRSPSTMSLLDENDELEQKDFGEVLKPVSISKSSSSLGQESSSSQAAESEDEWNW